LFKYFLNRLLINELLIFFNLLKELYLLIKTNKPYKEKF
jgi:hypothetical protein